MGLSQTSGSRNISLEAVNSTGSALAAADALAEVAALAATAFAMLIAVYVARFYL